MAITENGGEQVYTITNIQSYDSGNKIQVTLSTDHEFPVGFGNIEVSGTGIGKNLDLVRFVDLKLGVLCPQDPF